MRNRTAEPFEEIADRIRLRRYRADPEQQKGRERQHSVPDAVQIE